MTTLQDRLNQLTAGSRAGNNLPLAPIDTGATPQAPTQPPSVTPETPVDSLQGRVAQLAQRAQVQQPPAAQPQQGQTAPEGPTFESAARDPELIRRLRRYYGNYGKTFADGPEGDRAAFDHYVSDRVWSQDVNSLYMAREVDRAFRGGQTQREDLRYLRDTWNNLPNMFQEGGRSPLTVVPQYVGAALADPITYVGMGLGSVLGRKIAGAGINPVVSNLAGQAIADAGISAGQNIAQQTASIGVGAQSNIDASEAAIAGGIGAATGPALWAAQRGARAGVRGLGNLTTGGSEAYREELRRAGVDGLLSRMRSDMPGISQVFGQEQGTFRVIDRNGNVLQEFDNGREARRFAQQNNAVAMPVSTEGLTRINTVSSLVNSSIDHLTSLRRLSDLANSNQLQQGNPVRELDAYMFATNIGQNAMQTAQLAVAENRGGQFRYRNGYLEAIEGAKGLGEIVAPLSQLERGDIFRYRLAKRLEFMEAGNNRQNAIDTGLGQQQRQEYQEIIRRVESSPEIMNRWRPIIAEIDQFNKNHLDLMVDLGIYSPEMRQVVENANFMYTPIHRIMSNQAASAGELAEGIGIGSARERLRVRGISEGRRSTIDQQAEYREMFSDPARNYAQNIQASIALGIRNQLVNQLVTDINTLPGALRTAFGEVVGPERVGNTYSFENVFSTIERQLERAGVGPHERDAVLAALENARATGQQGALDYFTLFAASGRRGERFVPFYQNGQMRFLQINNQDLLNSMAAFGRAGSNYNFLADMTQAFQYLITRDPEFIIGTSLPTDMFAAQNYSNLRNATDFVGAPGIGAGAVRRLIGGFREVARRDSALYREAVANGVLYSGLGTNAADASGPAFRQFLARFGIESDNIFGVSEAQDRMLGQRMWTAARNAAHRVKDGVDYMAEVTEAAPRMGEFRLQRGVAGQSNARAAFNTIENNIDFRRRPANAAINEYLRVVPFLRAGNNVLYRLARSMDMTPGDFFDREVAGQRITDNFVRQAKIAMTVGLPVLYLAFLNAENPHYQGLSEEDRRMFHHIYIGDQHFRIRRTEDMALIANGIEQFIVNMQRDNLNAYEAMRQSVLGAATNVVPSGLRSDDPTSILVSNLPFGVRTGAGLALNQQFGGSPIETPDMRDRPLQERFRENSTSPLAIEMARNVGVLSPVQWEFIARDTLGPIWKYFGQDIPRALSDQTVSRGTGDIPVVRRFVRDVIQDMQSSDWGTQFYELRNEARQAQQLVTRPVQETLGRGNAQNEADRGRLNFRARTLAAASPQLETTARRIAQLRDEIVQAYNNPGRFAGDTGGIVGDAAKQRQRQFIEQRQLLIAIEQYAITKDLTMRLNSERY